MPLLEKILIVVDSTDQRMQSMAENLKGIVDPGTADARRKQRTLVQNLLDTRWLPTTTRTLSNMQPNMETATVESA
jgi:hypothetical protein